MLGRRQLQVDHVVGVPVDDLPVPPLQAEDHRDSQDLLLHLGVPGVEHVGAFDGDGVGDPALHVLDQVLDLDLGPARTERACREE